MSVLNLTKQIFWLATYDHLLNQKRTRIIFETQKVLFELNYFCKNITGIIIEYINEYMKNSLILGSHKREKNVCKYCNIEILSSNKEIEECESYPWECC